MQYQNLIRLFISAACVISLPAVATTGANQDAAKIAAIKTMYQQDIKAQGAEAPILNKFASPKLSKALKLEQDYFDKNQMVCGTGADTIWDSQDPDYVMPKISAQNDRVSVQLNHDSKVDYDVDCHGDTCKINDVTLDGIGSLQDYLTDNCK